ncbi:MmgE/PrpD family protein [Bosea sp. 117]|uniref:MmgE/PrpD family protein n=1 Tax=Bosea sp. 117 TaxID=1125973 RepID=UPI000494BBE8|nr:MmgE/PrpD family protein [Bosea sp. 117]
MAAAGQARATDGRDASTLAAASVGVSDGTRTLADYISGALARDCPDDVLERARLHLLDTLAACVSGSRLGAGQVATTYARSLGGAPACTVIGADFLTDPVNAALANGMMAHADETDDSHLGGRFHPGCGIVPAALAAAELSGAGGLALLKAVALGYDIGARVNLALGPRKLYAGGHSTHSVGALFGAAAAAGALMRFSPEKVRFLLSYAVQQASGVQCWMRDDRHIEKAFDFGGMPARNAMAGATMVAAGFSGVADALDGADGFFSAFAADPRPDELWKELGARYEIRGATIKKWCVGSPIQGAIDAVTLLMSKHGLRAEQVERLIIELPDDRCALVDDRAMPNINVQHLAALTLVDGGLSFASSHNHARMQDERVRALRARISLVPNAELTTALPPRQAIIRVELAGGGELVHRTHAVKGTPANPMDRAEVADKALDLVAPILGTERAGRLVATVLDLDRAGSAGLALRPLLRS